MGSIQLYLFIFQYFLRPASLFSPSKTLMDQTSDLLLQTHRSLSFWGIFWWWFVQFRNFYCSVFLFTYYFHSAVESIPWASDFSFFWFSHFYVVLYISVCWGFLFFSPCVSSMFIIAYWNIFIVTALTLGQIILTCLCHLTIGIHWLSFFHMRSSWFLGWWILFKGNACLFISCCETVGLTQTFCRAGFGRTLTGGRVHCLVTAGWGYGSRLPDWPLLVLRLGGSLLLLVGLGAPAPHMVLWWGWPHHWSPDSIALFWHPSSRAREGCFVTVT